MLYYLIFCFIYTILCGWNNYRIDKYKKVQHFSQAIVKGWVYASIPLLYLMTDIVVNSIYDVLAYMFIGLTIRWIVFDITFNLLRKDKWYYFGNTALMDQFFRSYHLHFKIICLFYSSYLIMRLWI